MHVIGPERVFPLAPACPFTAADAPKETLFALHGKLGISRCVIVQSMMHGFDNRAIADAIVAKSGAYCGVALAPATASDADAAASGRAGFPRHPLQLRARTWARGTPIDDVIAMTPRLAAIGLHLQVHFEQRPDRRARRRSSRARRCRS